MQVEVFVRPTLENGIFIGSNAVVLNLRDSVADAVVTQQLRAEFTQRSALTDTIFETIDQGVTVTNQHGELEYISPVFAQMLGYSPDEMLGKSMLFFIPKEEHLVLLNAKQERSEGWRGQYRHQAQRKDGSLITLEVNSFPRQSQNGINGSIALVRDISLEIEHAQEFSNLKLESERELEFGISIAKGLKVGLVIFSVAGRFEYVNPAFIQLLGYTFEEIKDFSAFDLVYRDDHAIMKVALEEYARGETSRYRYRLLHKDGHIVHVEAQSAPRRATDGSLLGIITTLDNITEQIALEQAANLAKKAFERESRNAIMIANAVPDGLLFVSAENLIEYANPSAVGLLGAQHQKELIGQRSRDWVYAPDIKRLRSLRSVLERGVSPTIQVQAQHPNGNLIPVSVTVHPRLERQKIVGSIIVIKDLRPELEQQKQLQEQQRVLLESQTRYRDLFLQSQAARARLELVDHIRNVAMLCDTVDGLVKVVVETLSQTLGTKLVSIYFLEDQELVMQHQVGYSSVITHFALSNGGVMVRAVSKPQVELITDAHTEADFRYPMPSIRSELAVPILSGQRVLGVINLESEEVAAFGQDDAHLLVQVAERIANKLEITQKLEQYQKLEQQYQALLEQQKS